MFSFLVSQQFVGDAVHVTVLRDGARKNLKIDLLSAHDLVPPHASVREYLGNRIAPPLQPHLCDHRFGGHEPVCRQ